MHYSMLQRPAVQLSPIERAFERYPMAKSDLLISDSSSSSNEEDVRDLIYRKFRFSQSLEPPFRISNENHSPNNNRRPPDIQPHAIIHSCVQCNRIRTNPHFRYSSAFCRNQRHKDFRSTSDGGGQYENDETTDEEETPKPRRSFPHKRRRIRPKSHLSGDAVPVTINSNGQVAPVTPLRTTSIISHQRMNSNPTTATMTPLKSALNNSLNNILKYSPPEYLEKNNVTKSTTSINSNSNNLIAPNNINCAASTNVVEVKPAPTIAATTNGNSTTNGTSNKIYGTSLLCYQNVSPPSPTSSIVIESNNSAENSIQKLSEESKTPKGSSKSSSAATLAALIPGDTTTLPVAVKKRSKLRHRFSDVGSWGLRKKDRRQKYRSMNIESLEVLGDPVIEDEFFSTITRMVISC